MPPRTSLTSSFSVTDASNEVVCPLRNQDGSSCRKRCFGEKRYRSMQEHIRRAHPDHYIPKLPATEESFMLMINTPPDQRPQTQHSQQSLPGGNAANQFGHTAFDPTANHYYMSATSPTANRSMPDFRRPSFIPAAHAAAALTQLHNSRPPEADWDADGDPFPDSDNAHNYFASDTQNIFSDGQPNLDHMTALSSGMNRPGPNNTSYLHMQRAKLNRPRKSSVAEDARKPKHERERSKDQKRISADLNKRFSSENSKRWEDLLDAAASATEEDSRDLTPIPQSPHTGSVPPFHNQNHNQFQSYNTSPLQNTVLPQSPEADATYQQPQLEAFPSVEDSQFNDTTAQTQAYHQHQSSNESTDPHGYGFPRHQPHPSGSNFHMPPEGLSSSPNDASVLAHSHLRNFSGQSFPTGGPTQQPAQQPVQHYCAACHRIASLSASYACTECICGICRDCVQVLTSMNPERGSPNCPHCATPGAKFKPFMLDLR